MLIVIGVNTKQHITGFKEATHCEGRGDLDDGARDLRHELARGPGLHGALAGHGQGDLFKRYRLYTHTQRFNHRGLGFNRWSVDIHKVGGSGGNTYHDDWQESLQRADEDS